MKIQLRPYQLEAEQSARNGFAEGKHIIVSLGCGSGKSVILSSLAYRAVKRNTRCLILSHRIKILRQNNGALGAFGLDPFVLNDNSELDETKQLYASSIQTLKSRFDKLKPWLSGLGLIIIDECHTQYANFLFESGVIDDIYVVGLTGTPYRYGTQRQLGMDYDVITTSVTVPELIAMGNVLPTKIFEVPVDVSAIEKKGGEFNPKQAYAIYDKVSLYGGLLENYIKHGEGGEFIGFCTNIQHAVKNTIYFCQHGYECRFVISGITEPKVPETDSPPVVERYKDLKATWDLVEANRHLQTNADTAQELFLDGTIVGVFSIEILSTGFDFQPLRVCLLDRATTSVGLFIQMVNRVTRVIDKPQFAHLPKKEYGIVIDMGENRKRLGDPDADTDFELWHLTSDTVGVPATKVCEKCKKKQLASYKICIKCGHRFKTAKELRNEELIEYLRTPESEAKKLNALAELKGYKKAWVFRRLFLQGEPEFRAGMRELGYSNKFIYGWLARNR